jgi:hypothetical protein
VSTVGCSVSGLKRGPWEERKGWFERVRSVQRHRVGWHDLMLVVIEHDAAWWAYLVEWPSKSRWRRDLDRAVGAAFVRRGLDARRRRWPEEEEVFEEMVRELLLTKAGR